MTTGVMVSVVALAVVAATVVIVFKMFLATQEAKFSSKEVGLLFAQQILDRMDAAFTVLGKVGKALDDATAKYHEALGKLGLEHGMQNIVTPAKELMRLTESQEKRNSKLLQQ